MIFLMKTWFQIGNNEWTIMWNQIEIDEINILVGKSEGLYWCIMP
jgi:hypothetical protein